MIVAALEKRNSFVVESDSVVNGFHVWVALDRLFDFFCLEACETVDRIVFMSKKLMSAPDLKSFVGT